MTFQNPPHSLAVSAAPAVAAAYPFGQLVELLRPQMACLYASLHGTPATVGFRLDGPDVILSAPHRVADVNHIILWKIPRQPLLEPDGTLPLHIAFAHGTHPPAWRPARLTLKSSLELLD